METLFLKIVNLSITASWLVLAVTALRFIFKKAPKWIFCLLWGLVALRLLCPFSIESALSLIPSRETLPQEIITSPVPEIESGIDRIDAIVNPILSASLAAAPGASVNPTQIWVSLFALCWLAGMAAMLIYALISYLVVSHRVSTATLLCDNIKQSETVDSPFVLGFFRPKIYLPYAIAAEDMQYVIAHERAHIRRKDHWWKPIGFMLLSVYWFNPVMWLAYLLLCRDIEAACDEKVISDGDKDYRKAYSTALLNCSVHRRTIAACPLAFGETGVKSRIKSVMNYKRPAFWLIITALIASIVAAVCLLTVPKEQNEHDTSPLYYKNVTESISYYETVQTIHYPVAEEDDDAEILLGITYCDELKEYLENATWTERRAPSSALPSHASVEFIIEEEYRVTVYKKPRIAKVRYFDEVRWYRTNDRNAYENAVSLAKPAELSSAISMHSYGVTDVVYDDGRYSFSIVAGMNSPYVAVSENMQLFIKESSSVFFGKSLGTMKKFELTKDNFDKLFEDDDGWHSTLSAAALRKNNEAAYQLLYDNDVLYYLLQQKNGDIYLTYAHYYDNTEQATTHIRWLMKLDYVLREDTGIIAVSGENVVPVIVLQAPVNEDLLNEATHLVDWLEIAPDSEDFTPFSMFCDGNELTGVFNIYDAETLESLDFFRPSGLSPQTYIFQEAEPGKDYIITMTCSPFADGDQQDVYVFGAKLPDPDAQPEEDKLETAISKAVLEHHSSTKPDGLLSVEAHKLLGKEEFSGTPLKGETAHVNRETVYLLVLHQKYSIYGGRLNEAGGSYIPTAITFGVDENGNYTLQEYWEPRDGAYYEKDIREKFFEDVADDALNSQDYIDALQEEVLKKAYDYLNSTVDLRVNIDELFERLCSDINTAGSSPEEYMEKYPLRFKELIGYGEATLRYCFEEFVSGENDSTKTELMSLVCQKISEEMGEALLINTADPQNISGTDWFDALHGNALTLHNQFPEEYLAKHYPISYILLQVIEKTADN